MSGVKSLNNNLFLRVINCLLWSLDRIFKSGAKSAIGVYDPFPSTIGGPQSSSSLPSSTPTTEVSSTVCGNPFHTINPSTAFDFSSGPHFCYDLCFIMTILHTQIFNFEPGKSLTSTLCEIPRIFSLAVGPFCTEKGTWSSRSYSSASSDTQATDWL